MSDLSGLYAQLRYWQQEVRRLKEKIKKLKQRIKDVEKVKKELKNAIDKDGSAVNKKIRSTREDLLDGISSPEKRGRLEGIFSGKEEKGLGYDSNLTQVDQSLQKDLNETQRKLTDAQNELKRAESRVRDIQNAIARELL